MALVTGGNRGIGLAICRQLGERGVRVLVGARDPAKGEAAVAKLRAGGAAASPLRIAVDEPASVDAAFAHVRKEFGRLDILVNNAAIAIDGPGTVATLSAAVLAETLQTNLFGALRVAQAALALMRERDYGRIVNVSSGQGSFTKIDRSKPAYRLSKTALNALTRMLTDECAGSGILVNAMTPGWVRTHMGGVRAPRSVDEGADTAVWLATLPADGPRGGFFRDRQPFPW